MLMLRILTRFASSNIVLGVVVFSLAFFLSGAQASFNKSHDAFLVSDREEQIAKVEVAAILCEMSLKDNRSFEQIIKDDRRFRKMLKSQKHR